MSPKSRVSPFREVEVEVGEIEARKLGILFSVR